MKYTDSTEVLVRIGLGELSIWTALGAKRPLDMQNNMHMWLQYQTLHHPF